MRDDPPSGEVGPLTAALVAFGSEIDSESVTDRNVRLGSGRYRSQQNPGILLDGLRLSSA